MTESKAKEPAVETKKVTVLVQYTAWKGIVSERIIHDHEWKMIGIDFKTVVWDAGNNFTLDASDWPLDVMNYFSTDDEFTVVRDGVAILRATAPAAKLKLEGVVLNDGSGLR